MAFWNLGEELKNETQVIITCRCVTSEPVPFIDALSRPDLQSNLRILAAERSNKIGSLLEAVDVHKYTI